MTVSIVLLILISIWVGFYQLVKQQGRILLRLDELERSLRASHGSFGQEEDAVDGLAPGTLFPDFELPDVAGRNRGLAEFRGKRLLLIHWNFDCGFCEAISGELARLESDIEKQNARIVLLAFGDAAFNRRQAASHGLKSPILLVNENLIPEPFKHQGTPVAYFLDEHLNVAAAFASGADQVLALARQVADSGVEPDAAKPERGRLKSERSLSESRIERNGLRAGTRAPTFRLPDLHGHSVSLEDYRGQRVLLVFSDPHCGPCDELAPHLARLHREREEGLALILVGRGDKEENRQKAEKFGFEFPVVVQDGWRLSKEYGIFATPVAFLIGENGVISRDVAVGKDAILALALAAEAANLEESSVQ